MAVWLLGLAPAVFLPGALNRLACALMAELPGKLQRVSRVVLSLAGITLAASALLGQAPLAQLIGRAPRYEGLVALSVYLGAFLLGAWLLGPGANRPTGPRMTERRQRRLRLRLRPGWDDPRHERRARRA